MVACEADFVVTELGPLWSAAQPTGPRTLDLDLVSGPFHFEGLSDELHAQLQERFTLFLATTASAAPSAALRVHQVARTHFRVFDTAGWTNQLAVVEGDEFRIAGLGFAARGHIDGNFDIAVGFPEQVIGSIDNVLRVWIAHRLFRRGGLLLHSAGLCVGDRAIICPGRSGAGKSTLCAQILDAGGEVLSDELNAVMVEGERLVVERLPFAGDLDRQSPRPGRRLPLSGLLRLEKSDSHHISPVSRGHILATLVAAAPFINADARRLPALGERAAEIATHARIGTLGFLPNPEVLQTVIRWAGQAPLGV